MSRGGMFDLLQEEAEQLDVESEDTEKISVTAVPSPPATRSTRSRNSSPQKLGSLSPRIPTRHTTTTQVSKHFFVQADFNCWVFELGNLCRR
jgi:hypothetical protein